MWNKIKLRWINEGKLVTIFAQILRESFKRVENYQHLSKSKLKEMEERETKRVDVVKKPKLNIFLIYKGSKRLLNKFIYIKVIS